MGNTIDTYIPMYIAQEITTTPRDVVTSERWNELWNLSIMQGDYTALIVDLLCHAVTENTLDIGTHTHDDRYYTKEQLAEVVAPIIEAAPLPNAIDIDITDAGHHFTATTVEAALTELWNVAHVLQTAFQTPIADSAGHFTATNVEGALAELFTYADDGKELIADAITGKGVDANKSDSFQELADKIDEITTGNPEEYPVPEPGDPNFPTDEDLIPSNILLGVDIFGVTGTHVCTPPARYFGELIFTYTPYAV